MSTSPAPSAVRGDITLQPSYFTSSLYVDLLRDDITDLVAAFSQRFKQDKPAQPFACFKEIWKEQGWSWLHFKVFDGRARHSFISVTERLFLERLSESEDPITRVTCLFALYTFHITQPSGSTPNLYSLKHIAIPIDIYESVLKLPSTLGQPEILPLEPYVKHILSSLVETESFHILPPSQLRPHNPSILPREIFVPDGSEASVLTGPAGRTDPTTNADAVLPKKKGRPSKREKMRKAREALAALEKYADKNSVMVSGLEVFDGNMNYAPPVSSQASQSITHTLAAQPPSQTRAQYSAQKAELLDQLYRPVSEGESADDRLKPLERANNAVLARLKRIDQLAAEKGLEVGGEGGEKTGLLRVEQAVQELHTGGALGQRGGILGFLEGGGLQSFAFDFSTGVDADTGMADLQNPDVQGS